MMCAHSTPLPADAPAVQHAPDNILDGGPSILDAILYLIVTLLALAGIYAVPVAWNLIMIAQHTGFRFAPGIVYAVVAIVCVWQTVIARVRYRKEVR